MCTNFTKIFNFRVEHISFIYPLSFARFDFSSTATNTVAIIVLIYKKIQLKVFYPFYSFDLVCSKRTRLTILKCILNTNPFILLLAYYLFKFIPFVSTFLKQIKI